MVTVLAWRSDVPPAVGSLAAMSLDPDGFTILQYMVLVV